MFQEVLMKLLVEVMGKLITPDVVEKAKQFVVCWAKSQVAATDNKIDDAFVQILADALQVDVSKCP